jgi:purine-binding chemotaxis protein CheW
MAGEGEMTTDTALVMDEAPTRGAARQQIFRDRARVLSEIPAPDESGEKISILAFQLREELYGIEIGYLTETHPSVPLRRLPSAPSHLCGIVNQRGELLPALDLCPILGLPPQEAPKTAPALLVLSFGDDKLALVVDRAQEILTFPLKQLKPPPLSLEPEHALFVKGELLVGNRPLTLLDMEKLLQDPRLTGEKT